MCMIHNHGKRGGYGPFQSVGTVKTKDITVNKHTFSCLCSKDLQHGRSLQHYAGQGLSFPHYVDQSGYVPERAGCFHLYSMNCAIVPGLFTSTPYNCFWHEVIRRRFLKHWEKISLSFKKQNKATTNVKKIELTIFPLDFTLDWASYHCTVLQVSSDNIISILPKFAIHYWFAVAYYTTNASIQRKQRLHPKYCS